jgi:hypothetical protein
MVITLGEASRQTGKSKSAITKAIKNGRLSASKGDTGDWEIDPAELFRVYPVNRQPEDGGAHQVDPSAAIEIGVLRERCSQLENQLADLRQDRDHWRRQATALLTDQRQPSNAAASVPAPPQKAAEGIRARLARWIAGAG